MYQHLIMNGGSATSSPLHLGGAADDMVPMTTMADRYQDQSQPQHHHYQQQQQQPHQQQQQQGRPASTAANGDIQRLSTASLEEHLHQINASSRTGSALGGGGGGGGEICGLGNWWKWIPERVRTLQPHLTTLWNIW